MRIPTRLRRPFTAPSALALLLSLLAVPAFAGICQGGSRAGEACVFDSDCGASCKTGPVSGQACTFDLQCGRSCANNNNPCQTNANCPGSFCGMHACTEGICIGSRIALEEAVSILCPVAQ